MYILAQNLTDLLISVHKNKPLRCIINIIHFQLNRIRNIIKIKINKSSKLIETKRSLSAGRAYINYI